MSTPPPQDPRADQAAVSDESLLAVHEKLLGKQPDENANYSLMPLALLFVFSGLIFWAGTYLNRYSGHFDAGIFNENAHPTKGDVVIAKADPMKVGAAAYASACVQCHLPTGLGQPGLIPPLAESEWVVGSEERVVRIVLYGLTGPIHVKGTNYAAAPMPTFGKVAGSGYNWSDDKIAAVLTYVRQSFGNNAPPITGEQVAAIHGKDGDRKPVTQDELTKLP
jgi:mono/diheme cytochrome c family protein